MISDYFYMPAAQKATEEQRIEFTQGRLGEVKGFLSSLIPSDLRCREAVLAMAPEGVERSYECRAGTDWTVFAHYGHDGRTEVVFNRNHFARKAEEFQREHRCKIAEIDYLYLLMQVLRDERGIDVRPADSSLSIGLWHR